MRKEIKKAVAMLMIACMTITYMPTTAFAASESETNAVQIGNYYEVNDASGVLHKSPTLLEGTTQQTYADGKVIIDKTISATDTENVFDINLSVKTTEEISKITTSADAAVVLVLDCSGSMSGNRLTSAKKAAQTFINSFATDENGVQRKVAIVRYSGSKKTAGYDGANTVLSWTDASKLKTSSNQNLCASISNLKAGGATNTEAGLMLARNLLNSSDISSISNKNVVLLTDGNPTLGVKDSAESTYATSVDKICPQDSRGYSIDSVGEGDETTCDTHEDAETLAKALKTKGYGTYAIYVGDTKVDCDNCSLNKSGKNWLAQDCGFTTYSASDKQLENLTDIFENIVNQVVLKAQAWIVTDPMGTNIDFVKFNREANPVNEFNYKDGKITWDIKNGSIPKKETSGSKTTYTYTLSYRVKLDTLSATWKENTYYATNGVTQLTYLDSTDAVATLHKAYFNVPSVKGYAGDFYFTKVGSFGENLAGATFEITTPDKTGWKMSATSDSTGKVLFNDVPSGHSYVLKEVSAPTGYVKDNQTHNFKVDYGVVTFDNYDATKTVVNESKTVDITVTKVWNDADNQDGKRPESVTIKLFADGSETGKTLTLNESNNWTGVFKDLAAYKAGQKISYTVAEANVANGYTAKVTGSAEKGFSVENSHTPATTEVPVEKVWNDADNQDGIRPGSVSVQLYANGEAVSGKTLVLNKANDWAGKFTDLPVNKAGKAITYTVSEIDVASGYEAAVTGTAKDGFTVTNSHTPATTEIPVAKIWNDASNQDGIRPGSVKVQLKADGKAVNGKTLTLKADNNWSGKFTDLPVNKAGKSITYTVEELNVQNGYTVSITGDADNGFTVTNTHITEKTSISVEKVWNDANNQDGKRADSVKVKLLANNAETGKTVTLNKDNDWKHTFTNLDKYSNGQQIAYTVVEVDVPTGYTPTVTGTAKDGFTVTNSYTPEVTSISVTKVWNDANNQDGLRGNSVKVQLYANGKAVDGKQLTLTEKDNWFGTFTKLPVYESGKAIVYTVVEVNVPDGYVSVAGTADNGYTVTNSHTPATTEISVAKAWNDADNQDGLRPETVTVQLYADGEAVDGKTLTLSKESQWAGTFTNLPVNKAGKAIVYTVEEVNVADGYEATVTGSAQAGFTVTNTHVAATTDVNVTKDWVGDDGHLDARPDSITVVLLADGVKVDTAKLTAKDGWKYTFADLPQYKDGEAIKYTVEEVKVKGYTTAIAGNAEDGFIITNTFVPLPDTGDYNNMNMWLAIMLLSGGTAVVQFSRRKREE